jgi:hypothetical protein
MKRNVKKEQVSLLYSRHLVTLPPEKQLLTYYHEKTTTHSALAGLADGGGSPIDLL